MNAPGTKSSYGQHRGGRWRATVAVCFALAAGAVAGVASERSAAGDMALDPIPPRAAAPEPDTPCGEVILPGGARLPDRAGCVVVDAKYMETVAVVTWAVLEGDDPKEAGAVAETLGGDTVDRPVSVTGGGYQRIEIDRVEDITGDGEVDVVLREGEKSAHFSAYHILTRRKDGFGTSGTYLFGSPVVWKRKKIRARFERGGKFTWVFNGFRWARGKRGEKKVTGLTATAESSLTKNPASKAVDGLYRTAWAEGEKDAGFGKGLVIELPRKITLGRISFATGYDALSPKWGDLWTLNNQITAATLIIGGDEIYKNISMGPSSRWVDYIPSSDFRDVDRIQIVIEDVNRGSKWNDTCISEVEIYERP